MFTKCSNYLVEKICAVLNFLGKISLKFDDKKREKILQLFIMLIPIWSYAYSSLQINFHLLVKCVIGVVIMSFVILFSIDRKISPFSPNKIIVFLWMGMSVLQVIGGIVTSMEYLPMACVWLIGFPILFLIWNNRQDYETLMNGLYRGCIYSALFCMIYSIVFVPITSGGYAGIYRGINAISTHASAIFGILLFRILIQKKKKLYLEACTICMLVGFAFFSHSRSICLIMLGLTFVEMFLSILIVKTPIKLILKRVVILMLGSILMTVVMFQLNQLLCSFSEKQAKEQASIESVMDEYVSRIEGKDKAEGGIDNYSSGRISIWTEAISKFKIFGNPSRDHIITLRNGDVGNNAHNQFIQVFYNQGILAGIVFVIMVMTAFAQSIRNVLKETNKELYIQIFTIQLSYIGLAMFESIDLPFLYELSFIYLSSYVVLFRNRKK